ncbi:chromate transporter [Fictibacillus terranigra]|uniref:Chromate transporter n=1 Tax=Fictibacillus terranigra TaxID=3058424 RepID=A0ABT8EDP4_9BACL|nr:chromate transporter [Fictibacillus sp. CENA-BCM004]MDN4076048.1 chromate transporter [Fictibacillus sp. CENA-BCM004]
MRTYLDLVVGFARTGVTGYGGGPSIIPLIEYEAVKKYKWMNEDEFGETLALANTLPGPIATKMAAYIGFKVKGSAGAAVAILAHILPSSLAMMVLLGFLYSFRHSPVVKGMVTGVSPVIGVMLAVLAFQFLTKSKKTMGSKWMAVFAIVSFLLLQGISLHPGIVIGLFLVGAFILSTYKIKKDQGWKAPVMQERERQL